jgi:hypothetical protein
MDVNELLRMILETAKELQQAHETGGLSHRVPNWVENNTLDLAENVINLDAWIRAGGFLPSAWVDATIAETDRTRSAED